MADNSYFGVKLGEAINAGAGHIASALQRKYDLQRQNDMLREQRTREEMAKDEQNKMSFAAQGIDYDPANPAMAFSQYMETMKAKQSREGAKDAAQTSLIQSQADMYKKMAETGDQPSFYTDPVSGKRFVITLDKSGQNVQPVPETKPEPPKASAGQISVDRTFGKDYADWKAGGGYSGIEAQIKSMEDVLNQLKSGAQITGPSVGLVPMNIRKMSNPASVAAQQQVERAIQATLRQTLGAQFTENEGRMLMQRSFDPLLPPEENAKKLEAAIAELRAKAKAKDAAVAYYEQNGTLTGFTGSNMAPAGKKGAKPAPAAMAPANQVKDAATRFAELEAQGLTEEQIYEQMAEEDL